MHEILENFAPGQRVLDLGSGPGSFPSSMGPFIAIRADLDHPSSPAANFAQADAARLPFADRAFDAVISNHSLEHFHDLAGSLAEIGRVLKPTGALYIAVPDASTFCDRLVSLAGPRRRPRQPVHFRSTNLPPPSNAPPTCVTSIPARCALRFRISIAGIARICGPRRLLLVGGGTEISLHLFTYFARLSDRLFGTRLSVYGWALYFGNFAVPVDTDVWTNVCIRCGSGAQSEWLRHLKLVRRRFLLPGLSLPQLRNHQPFLRR